MAKEDKVVIITVIVEYTKQVMHNVIVHCSHHQ